ncbi:MAG: methionine--tRNA ligase [Pseudomonadota bacterium]
MNNYYITTPIYYVNDVPHIGSAYTTLACDVIARFMRLSGKEVKFLTGTDEHGQKVEKAATNAGISPKDFTDKMSLRFRELCEVMNFSNDDFIRTTEPRHINAAQALWKKLQDNGAIYLGSYDGWYSVRDEAFYNESELTEDGLAPTGAPVEWVSEPSYFFALSKWQDRLLEFYDQNPDFLKPVSRRNEVVSFVKSGLNDLSISRTSFKWGIPVPQDESHIMYVWLDALTNYLSALGYPEDTDDMKKFWPANVHVIGKDITRFHAVYWPAFLMAADLPIPQTIMAHGWWTNDGQKISKSLGNTIDPIALVKEFGLDQVRYFLMREVIFGNDGNYSRSQLIARINNELANKIGNLSQRTLSFVVKECGGVPSGNIDAAYSEELLICASQLLESMTAAINKYDISTALNLVLQLADMANVYIDKEAPWTLKKTDQNKMQEVLYVLMEAIRYIGLALQPFMPNSASLMLDQLGVSQNERAFSCMSKAYALKPGSVLLAPTPVFPRAQEV